MDLIAASKLQKDYRTQAGITAVLKGVDLRIGAGEFLGIVGPSGSGKSTLLYVLSGLEPATAGTVSLFGKTIGEMKDHEIADLRKHKLGFVFQFYNLLPNLTVLENVELPLVIAGKSDLAKAKTALGLIGLKDADALYPAQLSGGMQQRVAIARAMVNDPKIVFADEPTGNLDQKSGREIMGILKKLNQETGVTIVLVTHNLEHLAYCTRKLELIDGKIGNDETLGV